MLVWKVLPEQELKAKWLLEHFVSHVTRLLGNEGFRHVQITDTQGIQSGQVAPKITLEWESRTIGEMQIDLLWVWYCCTNNYRIYSCMGRIFYLYLFPIYKWGVRLIHGVSHLASVSTQGSSGVTGVKTDTPKIMDMDRSQLPGRCNNCDHC